VVTRATDSGGPFRSFRFEAFVTAHRELTHVRTRLPGPGAILHVINGVGDPVDGILECDDPAIPDVPVNCGPDKGPFEAEVAVSATRCRGHLLAALRGIRWCRAAG